MGQHPTTPKLEPRHMNVVQRLGAVSPIIQECGRFHVPARAIGETADCSSRTVRVIDHLT